jgi:molecular chaperone DnaK
MVRDAEAHAEEDRVRRELIEARNSADSMVYAAEKALRESGDKVAAAIYGEVQEKVAAVRQVLGSEDSQEIRNKTAELSVAMQKIGQAMYEADQAAGPAGPAGKPDDDVVEGEYKAD